MYTSHLVVNATEGESDTQQEQDNGENGFVETKFTIQNKTY